MKDLEILPKSEAENEKFIETLHTYNLVFIESYLLRVIQI